MSGDPDYFDLSDREVKLLRHSFARLARRYNVIACLIFDRLFELDPTLRPLFPDDMRDRNRKLMETIALIVQRLDQPAAVALLVRQLGQRYDVDYVLRQHHAAFGEALLWGLRYGLVTGYNDEVEQSWVRLYALLRALALERGAPA